MSSDLIQTVDTLIEGPARAPIDLEEVKKQRRFSPTRLDTLFDLWIHAAVQWWEGATGQQLITATWEYWLDAFPWQREIELPHPPLQRVLSVNYDDGEGVEQTLDPENYRVLTPSEWRGTIALTPGGSWPAVASQPSAVRIRYLAGLGDDPGDVPELTKYALMMLVGHFHKYGEEVTEAQANPLPMGATAVMEDQAYLCRRRLPPPTYGPYTTNAGTTWPFVSGWFGSARF